MKEENGKQDASATAFDYPTNVAPKDYNHIYHGNMRVPKPSNHAAKVTPETKVMRQVLEAK